MTVIMTESFTDIYSDLLPLFRSHWLELGPFRDRMPLAPNVPIYSFLERAGELVVLTARRQGELVGYLIAKTGPGLHYATTIQAITDIPYVHPSVRGRGIGYRLFAAAEVEFRRSGVGPWFASSKINSPLHRSMDRLLTRGFGMAPQDVQYSKWIE
jgi:GNAT superfamily N-acetyltransferase